MPYKHTNKLGHTYYLHRSLKDGISDYFFSRDENPDTACDLPAGFIVAQNKETGALRACRPEEKTEEEWS